MIGDANGHQYADAGYLQFLMTRAGVERVRSDRRQICFVCVDHPRGLYRMAMLEEQLRSDEEVACDTQ